ncbi:MAG TPA: hypothetical protein VFG20_11580, partial [Planctomycetaceae bacterium]|nr:hypothetical protein [Planctomycetaceae bacterium]
MSDLGPGFCPIRAMSQESVYLMIPAYHDECCRNVIASPRDPNSTSQSIGMATTMVNTRRFRMASRFQ